MRAEDEIELLKTLHLSVEMIFDHERTVCNWPCSCHWQASPAIVVITIHSLLETVGKTTRDRQYGEQKILCQCQLNKTALLTT